MAARTSARAGAEALLERCPAGYKRSRRRPTRATELIEGDGKWVGAKKFTNTSRSGVNRTTDRSALLGSPRHAGQVARAACDIRRRAGQGTWLEWVRNTPAAPTASIGLDARRTRPARQRNRKRRQRLSDRASRHTIRYLFVPSNRSVSASGFRPLGRLGDVRHHRGVPTSTRAAARTPRNDSRAIEMRARVTIGLQPCSAAHRPVPFATVGANSLCDRPGRLADAKTHLTESLQGRRSVACQPRRDEKR